MTDLTPAARIERAALSLARIDGLINLTCAKVCDAADVPVGSFQSVMGRTFTDYVVELRDRIDSDPDVPTTRTKAHAKLRRADILRHAVLVAAEIGYTNTHRMAVAQRAGVTPATVNNYFGTRKNLQTAVVREAVRTGCVPVVAQALANGHPGARKADEALRRAAAEFVAGRS